MSGIIEIRTGGWRRLPDGFAPDEPLYVLTDIHGCRAAMDRLLSRRPADARLVFLGDAVDRGPDPLGVIAVLMADEKNILLRGNHDAMAWFAQPGVEPSYEWASTDWMHNGGRVTLEAFSEALEAGGQRGEIAPAAPRAFEEYWFRGNEWWQSGNLVFVHAGMPRWAGREFLSMHPLRAATHDDSPYWWRPTYEGDLCREPRRVDGEDVFVVFGHSPLPERYALLPFGISLDRGYELKMAAEIRPDGRFRLVTTECDEVA